MIEQSGKNLPVETARPLSQSLLWSLQRRFYENEGVGAWGNGPVPYYITSTPFIARAYARMVLGFLRDCAGEGRLDREKPVYLVELGAGSGRFSYHFRRRLDELLRRSHFRDLRVTLVMSDFAEATVKHWRGRPEFARWVADGSLDFARFDVERDQELRLLESGAVLTPGGGANPIVCIANYVFDSVPQDAFRFEGGRTLELLAELWAEDRPGVDGVRLEDLRICFYPREVNPGHYGNADFDRLVEEYRGCLDEKSVLMPIVALGCIARLRALCGGRVLLLAGDKGYGQASELPPEPAPRLALHGSRSMMVNFDAIGRYARAAGGVAWRPRARAVGLHVGAFLFGIPPERAVETDLAYLEAVDSGGPDDFFSVQIAMEKHCDDMELDQILAYLRLSGWDSHIFRCCLPAIRRHLATARPECREALGAAIAEVDLGFLPTGEQYDLAYDLGLLWLDMDQPAAAAEQFEKSLQRHGLEAPTLINLSSCLLRLSEPIAASNKADLALIVDPGNAVGQQLRALLVQQAETRVERARSV